MLHLIVLEDKQRLDLEHLTHSFNVAEFDFPHESLDVSLFVGFLWKETSFQQDLRCVWEILLFDKSRLLYESFKKAPSFLSFLLLLLCDSLAFEVNAVVSLHLLPVTVKFLTNFLSFFTEYFLCLIKPLDEQFFSAVATDVGFLVFG